MTPWIDVLGWTLVHFVWQGVLMAAAAAVALRLLIGAAPHTRYATACLALAAMLAAPIVTGARLLSGPASLERFDARSAQSESVEGAVLPREPAGATVAASSVMPVVDSASGATGRLQVDAWLPFAVAAWLGGVGVLLIRLAGGCWQLRRLRRACRTAGASRWQAAAGQIASRLGLRRRVRIIDSPLVDTPTMLGCIRPVILLPVAALAGLTPAQVDAILAHELAHVRRHDYLVNLLQMVAETLLFYHPAVWWISARIRTEREHCCDDIAVEVCGDAVVYAEALTELASWSTARAPMAMAATSGSLIARVRRVLGVRTDDTRRSSSGTLTLALLMACLAVLAGARFLPVAPVAEAQAPAGELRFGPPDVNRLLGFDLLPVAPAHSRGIRTWGVTIDSPSGRMPLIGFTARSLIRYAYGLGATPIVDGPGWLDTESFDVSARTDEGLTEEEVRAALRRIWEDRLQLAMRRETRNFPVYALVRADASWTPGPNLRATQDCFDVEAWRAGTPPREPRPNGQRQPVCGGRDTGLFRWTFTGMTMAQFADELGAPLVDRQVVDRTGLAGRFDMDLRIGFMPAAFLASRSPIAAPLLEALGVRSVFSALPEQLGLRLEPSMAPFDVVVIDRVEKP